MGYRVEILLLVAGSILVACRSTPQGRAVTGPPAAGLPTSGEKVEEPRMMLYSCECENRHRFEPSASPISPALVCQPAVCSATDVCEEFSRRSATNCWPTAEPKVPSGDLIVEACLKRRERRDFYRCAEISTGEAVEQGVGPGARSPSALARRSTP